jgi:hypothetical protein
VLLTQQEARHWALAGVLLAVGLVLHLVTRRSSRRPVEGAPAPGVPPGRRAPGSRTMVPAARKRSAHGRGGAQVKSNPST